MDAARIRHAAVVAGAVTALTACGAGGTPPQAGPTVTVTAPGAPSVRPAPRTSTPAGTVPEQGPSQEPSQKASRKPSHKAAPAQPATVRVTGVVVGGLAEQRYDDGTNDSFTSLLSETVRDGGDTCTGHRGAAAGPWTKGLVEGARIVLRDPATGREVGAARLYAGTVVDVDPGPGRQLQCEFGILGDLTGAAPDRLQLKVDGARTMNAVRTPGTRGRYVASVSTDADPGKVIECRIALTPSRWDTRAVGAPWDTGMETVCGAGLPVSAVERVCRPARIASDRVVAVLDANNRRVLEDARGLHIPTGYDFGRAFGAVVQVSTGVPCR